MRILATKQLNDHSDLIKDIFPDLLKLSPMGLAEYLEKRLLKVEWTP
jgi:hypothetical protein